MPLTDEQVGQYACVPYDVDHGAELRDLAAELLALRPLYGLLPNCPKCDGTTFGLKELDPEPYKNGRHTQWRYKPCDDCKGNPVPGKVHPVPYFTEMRDAGDSLVKTLGPVVRATTGTRWGNLANRAIDAWAALPIPPAQEDKQ